MYNSLSNILLLLYKVHID
uniref:Uncharacterized protein n=1 Tax=Anguilla anguilla TaxID=7936 RepID=A0A0E9SC86_ANGAN